MRVEPLSGFFNGIFLVFVAFKVFCESIDRIYEPANIEQEGLLLVSVLGFLVNCVGLACFHDLHSHGGEPCSGHAHDVEEGEHDHHDHSHSHSHSHSHDHDHKHDHDHDHTHEHEHDHEHDHSHSHDHAHDHGHSHAHAHDHNENVYGVFLHILADTLGSVGVIISSLLIKYYDLKVADPICSVIISLFILASVIPLI